MGWGAMIGTTTGYANIAVGLSSLANNSTGYFNTTVGYQAGSAVTTASHNTLIGGLAGDALTTGASNVAVGYGAFTTDDVGQWNVAIGRDALASQNTASAANTYNTAVGGGAGQVLTIGTQNTALGGLAGNTITTGSQNTMLGYAVQVSGGSGTRQIVIGSNQSGGGDNTVRIGTVLATATLSLDGSDTSWAAASDERLKTEIANSSVGLSFINALRPVTYKWAAKNAIDEDLPFYDADSSDPCRGTEGKTHHGFIAQEVKAVIDANSGVKDGHNIWSEDPNGTQQLAPAALIPMLVKAIQELTARIEALES
jgi:hypothetical protein